MDLLNDHRLWGLMINTRPLCNYRTYWCPPSLPSHLYQAGWRQRKSHCGEGHSQPQQHNHGHFVRVTEHFTLHQTQRHPLRQDIRKHSFHFLTLNTKCLRFPPSHSGKKKEKKGGKKKKFKYPFTRSHLARRASTLYWSVFLLNDWPREWRVRGVPREQTRLSLFSPQEKKKKNTLHHFAWFEHLLFVLCLSACVWGYGYPDTQVGLFRTANTEGEKERQAQEGWTSVCSVRFSIKQQHSFLSCNTDYSWNLSGWKLKLNQKGWHEMLGTTLTATHKSILE